MFLRSLAVAVSFLPASSGWASEISGQVTISTEYIYRGQAVSDGDPVLQAGLDYQHDSGIYGGIWGSTINLESRFSERDRELDFYVGYYTEVTERFALSGTLMRYTYPGQRGINYDYTASFLTATLDDRHSLELGFTRDLYGIGGIGRYLELRSERSFRTGWIASAGLGRNDLKAYGGARYLYGDIGASARVSWLMIDLRWHENEPTASRIGGSSAGSSVVLSLSGVF